MPKLIISKNNLPDIDAYTNSVRLRFRIISDDRNISSYWSPIYSVEPKNIYVRGTKTIGGSINLEKHTGYVSVVWDSVSVYKENDISETIIDEIKNYDVWVKFADNDNTNESNWIYKERVSSTSLNILIPSQYESNGNFYTPKWMYVEIYRPANPILRYEKAFYEIVQDSSSVDIANDKIILNSNHGLKQGDSVIYYSSSAVGGLNNDSIYWVNPVDEQSFNIFSTQNDALNNLNKIDLTSTGSGSGIFRHYPFLSYRSLITTL